MASTQSLQALLEQTGWIHSLARQLVADPHLAADLAQETAVEALERDPDAARPLRGWLATVMRHQLAKLRRGERNRAAREQAPRREEPEPAALDVVERAETHRNVVLAVLALEEPYRSTLLMRFFEQLPYDEIARRTSITRAAVNSRITRGLERLRLRLETTYGGDRRALCLALIPLAKLPAGLAATTTLGTLVGTKTMQIMIGTAAATLLAATVSVGVLGGGREPSQDSQDLSGAAALPEPSRAPAGPSLLEPLAEPGREPLALPLEQREERKRVQKEDDQNVWRTELFHAEALAPTVESLVVNTSSGDIEVLESRSGRLEIQAKVRARLGTVPPAELTQVFEDHVDVFEEEGVLHIEDKHRESRGWNVSFVVGAPGRLPLGANSGSGDILVRRAQGKVGVNTGSGDVRVDLATERLASLGVNTGSGDLVIEVASVEDKLDANTGSGDVTVRIVEASSPGKARLNSGSGDLHLIVPPGVVGTFDLETHGDDIELPRALGIPIERDGGRSRALGTVGSGGGSYRMRSGSGDIRVELGTALPAKGD